MNIYLYELKANRKFAIAWLAAIIGIVLFLSAFYPMFYKDMNDFTKLINNLPSNVRLVLGMNTRTITTILGYYAFILTLLLIFASIEAMILGLSILSKEIRERTADFLLSKPVSRIKIVTSKILSSITLLVSSNIIYFISFYMILSAFSNKSFNIETYILLTLIVLFIQIIFFSLGIFLSVIMPKIKAILPISLGTAFGLYMLGIFSSENLRVLMPFKYFNITYILLKNSYELKYLYISMFIIIIFISLTYIIYKNKDIDAV